ncbi:glutathione peroxidase [Aneurinibacillus migulanus]|uniref:Glutathione peroxidase n=1 Tax=Aneurinibacillus migulanus TaxID=47500 RepID=A0A0D1VWN2_ANEMI|nr:glutathione peroxidase [Aneurinibacillus migulanus]KIV50625.1 glutathione peroxidase [Aneurinibacillus migulanus]KON97436.1 glutathione peroxidase [Aneurinibacillus migulanus]MED0895692.1 glutathione peroxidase [Aneurinibacillus migulanus]MED1619721.1 glutathione peroxidase [Aneurinibacillus migulanus]SDK49659.1 glutathione peroxidase [Aneurinibacillus migulanus]
MSIYDFQATLINGKQIKLSDYRGKVLLIVNTASQCGFSRQFADLQKLYESRREQGFEILAFPCNQFNEKEPGINSEIQESCKINHGVTFPIFEKTDVRGPSSHPLFLYLIQQIPFQGFDIQTKDGQWMEDFLRGKYPEIYAGDGVKWNFSKFLIDRDGHVKERFESTTEPFDIDPAIESLL